MAKWAITIHMNKFDELQGLSNLKDVESEFDDANSEASISDLKTLFSMAIKNTNASDSKREALLSYVKNWTVDTLKELGAHGQASQVKK